MTDDVNYTKEAFLTTWNLVFLLVAAVTIAGLGIAGLVPGWMLNLIVVLSAGAELIYLGVLPRTQRFQRSARFLASCATEASAVTPSSAS